MCINVYLLEMPVCTCSIQVSDLDDSCAAVVWVRAQFKTLPYSWGLMGTMGSNDIWEFPEIGDPNIDPQLL